MVTQPLHELPTFAILFFFGGNCQKSVDHLQRLWQFAQWLCDHIHIAAITARYANELEAES
jgi:hypothetical protein